MTPYLIKEEGVVYKCVSIALLFFFSFFVVEMSAKQSTNRIIMVRPACFCFNTETAISNAFQNTDYSQTSSNEIQKQALLEFDRMVEKLRSNGIHVDVFDDTSSPIKPDAIFPNNWFSTHPDGTIVLYPMLAENRRLERRNDLIKKLVQTHQVTAVIDLSAYEQRQEYLEGTGSLVLDHLNRIIYAVRSPRTHSKIINHWMKLLDYRSPAMIFDSLDGNEKAIYHTNVMMAIGTNVVVICSESIRDEEQRKKIIQSLTANNQRNLLEITLEQMNHFAGNMLELQNERGEYFLVMSKAAYDILTDEQRQIIEQSNTKLLYFDVPTIEQCGGGSVRCMIAENFLSSNL